jgi:AbiJ N-terminal domain 4
MDSFSERFGFTKPKSIQLCSLDSELRNSLWNVCRQSVLRAKDTVTLKDSGLYGVAYLLFVDFYNLPSDSIPHYIKHFIKDQLTFFQTGEWYLILNYLEFTANNLLQHASRDRFIKAINSKLEEEKSAYRFVGSILAPITNLTEINEIEVHGYPPIATSLTQRNLCRPMLLGDRRGSLPSFGGAEKHC